MTFQDDIISLDFSQLNRKRWVSYFDLLGFSDRVKKHNLASVFGEYEKALRELHWRCEGRPTMGLAWFSDTFLIYAPDDSKEAFGEIDRQSRLFMEFLLRAEIPLQGAMSCDEFYVDQPNQVFLGKGLVEAYEYGSCQDWIGLVLCPSVIAQLTVVSLNLDERSDYALWPVPMKPKRNESPEACLYAYKLGALEKSAQGNALVPILERMRSCVSDDSIRRKYDHTLRFLSAR
ncbi:MAG: hypothetical protein ABSD58_16640 [Verrucomicrobiia bacterium]